MKRVLILLVVLLCIIGASFGGYLFYKNQKSNQVHTNETTQKSNYGDITFDVVSEWNDHYQLHVMYPVTPNDDIDNLVRKEIDEYVTPFKQLVASGKPKNTKRPYSLTINGDVNYADEHVINFVYTGSEFNGESENSLEQTQLFDRQTGQAVPLASLFKDDQYLQILSTITRQKIPDILKQNYNQDLVNKGTEPITQNFEEFELVSDKIFTIVFEPGQVADKSVGLIKVPIEISSVQSDLNVAEMQKLFPASLENIQKATKAEQEAKKNKDFSAAPPISPEKTVNCAMQKCIALTFDDGPGGATTQTILDTLSQNNAKATFFMIGRQVSSQSTLVKQIYQNGHEIGNHTWDHVDLAYASATTVKDQINRTNQAVVDVVGKRPVLVRPPYGSYNQAALNAAQLPFILWSVDPKDWQDKNADIVYQRVMSGANNGAIILSHDIYPSTAEAYKRIIPELKQQGYNLVTVSDLLDINDKNPPVQAFRQRN